MSDVLQARPTSFLTRLPLARNRPLIGYAVAIALSLVALWLRQAIGDELPPGFPFLTFFPAVIISAFFFGLGPGILTATLSGLFAWYFFIPSAGGFMLRLDSALALALYVTIVSADITLTYWMQRANAALEQERKRSMELAQNRELLFKELQHRVGNNLQMIASLIALQKRRVTDEAAKTALDEASRRLGLVGRIQRQLYDPAGAQLSLAAYIDQICRDVIAASGSERIAYKFKALSDGVLPPEKAIPTALVIAEALNNAIEHGFAENAGGQIAVTVGHSSSHVEIVIADDGAGLPAGFDVNLSESLGLKIARTLAQSLGGSFTLSAAPVGRGTVARLMIASDLPDLPLPG
ncbi:MAG TPA: histidine kinase dimerization/phosphoacceptor domain -containing protein [Lautropia sp.]|nr:histidine kinase dimerization/phosphoacceptor domain -containing protein [Lautropia sp.]